MSIEIRESNYSSEINENTYINYIKKWFQEVINADVQTSPDGTKENNIAYFSLYVLSPVFEEYIVEKLREEKWIDLSIDDIKFSDKQIFPEREKTAIKYFNQFLSDYYADRLVIQSNFWGRPIVEEMNLFKTLPPYIQIKLFKIAYYWLSFFDAPNRILRTKVYTVKKELHNLKKEVKKWK